MVNLELHFARNRSGIVDVPPKPLSANQIKAQATAARLEKARLQHLQFKDSQFLNQTVQEFDDKKHLLMEDWLCKDDLCPNQGNHCWVDQHKHHRKVEISHFNTWLRAIQKGDRSADYKTPPNEVKLLLKRSKTARDARNLPNPFATPTPAAPTLAAPTPLPLPIPSKNPTEPLMGIMQHCMMFKMAQSMGPFHPPSSSHSAPPAFIPIAPTSQLPQLPASTPAIPPTPHTPITRTRSRTYSFLPDITDRPSSPVEGLNIVEYIQWHIDSKKLTGNMKRGFMAAGNILEGQGYDLQTVQRKKNDEQWWKGLDIKPGIGIQLARDVTAFNAFQAQKSSSTTKIICSPPAQDQTRSYTSSSIPQPTQTFSPQNTLLFATQDESQRVTQLDEYDNGFEDIDMEQYEDGLIISEDDDTIPAPVTRHAASWVKGRGIDTQGLEDMTDSQREAMRNAYMAELELNDLDIE